MTAVNPIAEHFGADAARYVEMIDALALTSHKTRYSFTAEERLLVAAVGEVHELAVV